MYASKFTCTLLVVLPHRFGKTGMNPGVFGHTVVQLTSVIHALSEALTSLVLLIFMEVMTFT